MKSFLNALTALTDWLSSCFRSLSVIDVTGLLQFVEISDVSRGGGGGMGGGGVLKFERKDVWDMRWADDNPDLFAMMEKTRMYIFR